MKRILLSFSLIIFSLSSIAQQRSKAFEMNDRLGRGINMGNAFEAPDENAWGNPWKPEYFQIMADMGFQHVRLPIRWETPARSQAAHPYTINQSFLSRIKQVVDLAIEKKLIIIINMHHHELLFEDPVRERDRFLAQWRQIAEFFKDYPEELIFEVLNEPHGNLNPEMWNELFADALSIIRQTNPTRTVLLGTAEFGGLSGLAHLEVPEDENIIVTVHYYNPFNFTHQGAEWVGGEVEEWLGIKWLDTEAERESIISEFMPVIAFSEKHNVPIHVGEFGAYSKADMESRVKWTNFVARWLEEKQMSWGYWEFSAGFGIYNPATKQILQPLADALLVNEMAEPSLTEAVVLYKSNFNTNTDGWNLQVQQGLNANLRVASGKLTVGINSIGNQAWQIQLAKNNLSLHEGRMYRISVKASAAAPRNVTYYMGKASDPWNSYSGYNSISLSTEEKTFQNTFTMSNPSDTQARFVFDLGNSSEDIVISEVKFEEIRIKVVTSILKEDLPGIVYYPNPVSSYLELKNVIDYQQALLFDMQGRNLETYELNSSNVILDMRKHPFGVYMLRLHSNFRKTEYIKLLIK